ncbi:MAG: F0F1 ATP synthase subunit B [Bifidobacteriaceae bacterium]|jgi:F-type H+-transporting ATPase subunit b|nr:F0F1 ATP synthase subunit B [Bifidobacteriaceae bacterium]
MAWLSEDSPDGIKVFLPEPSEILWSTIIVVIIGVVFYFFIMPKFTKILDERSSKIEGNIEQATQKLQEADQKLAEYDQHLQEAKVDAAKIIQDANQHATKLIEDTQSQTEKDYRLKMNAAEKQIEDQIRAAQLKLRKNLGDTVVELAEKVLEEKFSDRETQVKNIDNFIDDLAKNDSKNPDESTDSKTESDFIEQNANNPSLKGRNKSRERKNIPSTDSNGTSKKSKDLT